MKRNGRLRVCFFSHTTQRQLQREQYSANDIRILRELGYEVTVATRFGEVPFGCDAYFSWWAGGSILPLIKARLSGRPIVIVAGGNDSTLYRDSRSGQPYGYLANPWYKRLATRLSLRFGTAVLAVSEFMIGDVRKLGATGARVVHNAVDTARFSPGDVERTAITTILNLEGDVGATKRGDVLLRAIPLIEAQRPGQRYVVIGRKGDAFERTAALARSLGVADRIEFTGPLDNDRVVERMQRSLVYVQISDTETFGVAIAEAMACGTPVVVSRRGAIPEVVGEAGVYVDHNDPAAVAAGVLTVLTMSGEQRTAAGLAGRDRVVERFSYERRRESIAQVLNEVVRR
jgi:glycosyltransferase involved in cell wall biosynthesis